MKKILFLLFLALTLLLTACGGGMAPPSAPAAGGSSPEFAPQAANDATADFAFAGSGAAPPANGITSWQDTAPASTSYAAPASMIIYHANASIRTEAFDDTIASIHALIDRHRGFIQHSNISGIGQVDWQGNPLGRHADFSIRIPATAYRAVIHGLEGLGTVGHLSETATNVSGEYADIASRLASLRVQEERILAMLERADTLADMIELEARLGELIFQIERFTAQRNHLDHQITYSTIELWITEVLEGQPLDEPGGVLATFTSSLGVMGEVGHGLIHFLAAAVPWLIVLALIALPAWRIILWHRRKQKRDAI